MNDTTSSSITPSMSMSLPSFSYSSSLSSTTPSFSYTFTRSLVLTTACEFCDRTFFLAAALSARHSRVSVFFGVMTAVTIITLLSTVAGRVFPILLSGSLPSILSSAAFLAVGISSFLHSSSQSSHSEYDQAQQQMLTKQKEEGDAFIKAFWLTMAAECGDRSQVAIMAFAASGDVIGVVVGCLIGHALCTALAVGAGKYCANAVSERSVALVNAALFIAFSAATLVTTL